MADLVAFVHGDLGRAFWDCQKFSGKLLMARVAPRGIIGLAIRPIAWKGKWRPNSKLENVAPCGLIGLAIRPIAWNGNGAQTPSFKIML